MSAVAKRLKGGASRVLRAEFPGLTEFLWGGYFWWGGYFAENVSEDGLAPGQAEEAVVSRYIREQQR